MLQRISERIETLPVEEWAAAAGGAVRRLRRRLARRRARVALGAAFALVVVAVGGNALWSQAGTHPAPLWREADPARVVLASHGAPPAGEAAAAGEPEVDRRAMVAEVQGALKATGYYDGPSSGTLDDATAGAIRAFERDAGLVETGAPSVPLLAALTAVDGDGAAGPVEEGPPAAAVAEPGPAPGSSRHEVAVPSSVADIQRLLNQRGYGPLTVDGQMGKRTRQALDAFAARAGLSERDGLSPEVLKALAAGA